MTNFERVKQYARDHKGEVMIAAAIVGYVGSLVVFNNGYKKGFKVGYEKGCNDTVYAFADTLENLKLLEKHQLLSTDRLIKVSTK